MHGLLGAAQEFIGAAAIAGKQGNARAAGDSKAQGVEAERPRHGFLYTPGGVLGAARIGLMNQQRKLVGPKARHQVHLAQTCLQAFSHLTQHPIAVGMAERVVDLLEAIQIDIEQGKRRTLTLGHGLGVVDAFCQGAAVGQAGQEVGMRQFLNALACSQLFAEVTEGVDPPDRSASAELGQRHPLQHTAVEQADDIAALQECGILNGSLPRHIGCAVDHTAPHPGLHGLVIAFAQQVGGDAPERCKPAVERADAPGQVHHQDAVGSGFQRGLQLGHQGLTLFLSLALQRLIAHGHQPKPAASRARIANETDAARHPKHLAFGVTEQGV